MCYAFLSDVPSDEEPELLQSSFRKSRWFRRGWTLQELIAPMHVLFLNRDWKEIGTKWNLQTLLSEITRIQTKALVGTEPLSAFSVAQKMSWASKRKTTRDEDIAYCMIGIFDINMPMLYGEGRKAFTRLQEHILANFDDDSIFAWWTPLPLRIPTILSPDFRNKGSGLLADSPGLFARSGNVVRALGMQWTIKVSLIRGRIRLEAPIFKTTSAPGSTTTYTVPIRCRIDHDSWRDQKKYLAIRFQPEMLSQHESSTELYVRRTYTSDIHTVPSWQIMDMNGPKMETMSVRKTSESCGYWANIMSRELQFKCVRGQQRALVSLEAYPLGLGKLWGSDKTLVLRIKDSGGLVFDVLLSFQPHPQILTGCVLEQQGNESLEDVYFKSLVEFSETSRFEGGSLAKLSKVQTKLMKFKDQIVGTSDRIQHRHKVGALTSLSIKKIGYREDIRSFNIDDDIYERVFFNYQGGFRDGLDKPVPRVDEKYLIELRLD